MSDDLAADEEHQVFGLGARIMLAAIDGDEAQAAELIDRNISAAIASLVGTTWGVAQVAYGTAEAAREAFAEAAVRAELYGLDEGEE